MLIRNRFDLLSKTEKERQMSVKFMNQFVKYMSNITQTQRKFSLFEISYYTSHTMENELRKYSLYDIKYVGISFLSFWIIYFFLSIIDFGSVTNIIKSFILKNILTKELSYNIKKGIISKNADCCVKKSIFIPLMSLVQFICTIIASLGLISLLGVEVNQLLYSSIFVIMSKIILKIVFLFFLNLFSIYIFVIVNGCHQSLLVNKNIKKLIDNNQENFNKELNENLESEFKYSLTNIIHLIIVPNGFTLLTIVLAYSVISLTCSFDSIRIYSLFLSNIFKFLF
jgi:hypothetical protein